MTDLKDLARRVSELQGPSREVDAAIQIAVFGDVAFGNVWPFTPESTPMLSEYVEQFRDTLDVDDAIPDDVLPRVTASLDAAMTLVPEGCLVVVKTLWDKDKTAGYAIIQHYADTETCGKRYDGETTGLAATPALALTAAALIARSEA